MTIMFDYTQSKFWGGSWYPYWSLILITVIGGFIGLDHLWLRSPLSAFLKFIINILTLGLWYFYDILQILGEKDSVMKNGLSAPIIGPLGIGAGMFKDSNPDGPTAKSPYKFMAYMFLMLIPFGFDLYIAGDTNGAFIKFLLTILLIPFVLPFFISIIWGFINAARSTFMPKELFTKGTYRMFPVSWFMDPFGPSTLGPVDLPSNFGECPPSGLGSVAGSLFAQVPIVRAATTAVEAAAATADIAKTAAQSTSSAIESSSEAYKTILDSVINPAVKLIGTGTTLTSQLASIKDKIPTSNGIASLASKQLANTTGGITSLASKQLANTTDGIASLTSIKDKIPTSNGIASLAAKKILQKGGGGGNNDISGIALLILFTIIIGGGTISALNRMNMTGLNNYLFNSQKDNDDDTPPKP
jgi:hypothetical protein